MSITSIFLIPLAFGLFGFIEPCSLGINTIFLNHINKFSKARRIFETLLFTFIRGFILALVGLSAAFIGKMFITVQASLFTVLGVIYIALGLFVMIKNSYFSIDFSKHFRNKSTISYGLIFGVIIPACSIPFIVALMGQAAVMQNLFEGFVTLFVFGIALSLPLLFISMFEKSNNIIRWLSKKAKNAPIILGIILIIFGLLTIFSKNWWLGAL